MSLYFVDPVRGDDGNDGTSQEKPFKTIERAIPELGAGDVLRLHAGTVYGPSMAFPREMKGSAKDPIVVEPYAGAQVTFDGRITDPPLSNAPNNLWERAPGGHPDEWRTRDRLNEPQDGGREQSRVRYGAFADTRLRLITYSKMEDLRATNESFQSVPLSDPRLAGGPLEEDPTRKTPWTYLGPGLRWVFEHPDDPEDRWGRVHVRLSPTSLNAPGTQDYAGPSNPNEVALALTPEGRIVLRIGASNVEFRHIVIANGGTTTLNVTEHARNITFDHCTLYGGRFGARISGNADGIRFKHCTFDGALAPWTVRTDVKARYTYLDAERQPVQNVMGNETHDILAISHAADNVEFAHCTFRRGHDGLQIGGTNVSVHHSLFEDLNDEVLQFNATSNAHIYKNLIRQALNPLSFALEQAGGPVFIYRNVIDQRVPTRGYRRLPPDAPGPHIWRYGTSYKMGLKQPRPGHPGPTMPDVYVYQNTFIASHPDDKASVLSALFASGELSPEARRIHLNNLLVGLNLDMPYSWAMPTSANRRSAGNLWYEPHQIDAPLFQFQRPDGSVERVETVAELRELDAAWELGSRFAEPRLANFDDEFFDHGLYLGEAYPNNDFRPAPGSPAAAAGVVLPPDLTDPDRPADDARPDIGALSSASPPFAVGVDDAVVLPAPGNPIAHAGPDQTVTDGDGDGFESVTIDGSESVDAGGAITAYAWILGGVRIASQPIATLFLPEGDYYLRLIVTNRAGKTDSDGLRIRIRPPAAHGDNPLRCPGFEETPCGWDIVRASIVTSPVHTGRRALRMQPSQRPLVRQRIAVSPLAKYRISAWIRRGTELTPPLTVRAVFPDAGGGPPVTNDLLFAVGGEYVYREGTVVAPSFATVMDLFLGPDLAGGPAFFDDVRVLDANLLSNAGFEIPAPTGQDDAAPGWRFQAGGARVITAPANVRSGTRAVALDGIATDYRQVTQEIRDIVGGARYRVSAWLKTEGLGANFEPRIFARFAGGPEQVVAETMSEGRYGYVSREFTAPPSVPRLMVGLHLKKGAVGSAYFDDLLVEPLD